MIADLDASALVKRYLVERGSRETIALTADSEMLEQPVDHQPLAAVMRS